MRLIRHLFTHWTARRQFPQTTLAAIQHAIAAGEQTHRGEIVFAVEPVLRISTVLRGKTAHARALEVFSHLRVWDTRENTGVLVYVLLADHAVEIVADRGIAANVTDAEWRVICDRLLARYAASEFESGSVAAIGEISDLLVRHFPAKAGDNPNELPNRVVIL